MLIVGLVFGARVMFILLLRGKRKHLIHKSKNLMLV